MIRVMTILEEFDGDTSYPGSKSYSDLYSMTKFLERSDQVCTTETEM